MELANHSKWSSAMVAFPRYRLIVKHWSIFAVHNVVLGEESWAGLY